MDVNETLYDPDDVILQAVRDAADAEFPGVANFYEDRFGRAACSTGASPASTPRAPKPAGRTGTSARGLPERGRTSPAQVREFSYNIPRARIINSYLAWPKEDENGFPFDRALIQTCCKTYDATSIGGVRLPRTAKHPTSSSSRTSTTRTRARTSATCSASSTSRTTPRPKLAVQSHLHRRRGRPADSRAAATWDLMLPRRHLGQADPDHRRGGACW